MNIRIAICGYGNLGRGVERALQAAGDMEPVAIVTRRPPKTVHPASAIPVLPYAQIDTLRDRVDVLILCSGSAADLPHQTPELAADFNTVDSFDTHGRIPAHFAAVHRSAAASGHLSLISAGWDPGLFSVARVLFDAVLPDGATATFWGKGVSQGHSDALRRIPGVLDAREYTVPIPGAMELAENGSAEALSPTATHRRECFVVPAEDADRDRIVRDIRSLPDYFLGYDTTVTFIMAEELKRDHAALPHGGRVIRSGKTGDGSRHRLALDLRLDSNPAFTGGVLVAYARAVYRLHRLGQTGCITPPDVPPAALSPKTGEVLRAMI